MTDRRTLNFTEHLANVMYSSMVPIIATAFEERSEPNPGAYEGVVINLLIAMRSNLNDSIAEAIAHEANCCGGIAHSIWEKAIDAALSEPQERG